MAMHEQDDPQRVSRRPPWARVLLFLAGMGAAVLLLNLVPYDRAADMPPVSLPPERIASLADLPPLPQPGEIRLLFVGASLTAGYPYQPGDRVGYPDLVGETLTFLLPERKVVWRTLAVPALDSPRLVELGRMALAYRPRALLFCVGANEFSNRLFYGRHLLPAGPLARVADHFSRARVLVRRLHRWLDPPDRASSLVTQDRIREKILTGAPGRPAIGGLPVSIADREYLIARMEENMARIHRHCAAAGVPLLFLASPDNLGGAWPWAVVDRPEPAGLAATVARCRAGKGSPAEVERLLDLAPGRADLHFMRGLLRQGDGQFAAAREDFLRAATLDQAPMRATPRIRAALRRRAAALGRPCIELDAGLVTPASGEIPDPAFFLDHAHITMAGQARVALHLVGALAEAGRLPPLPAGWRERARTHLAGYLEGRIDPAVRGAAQAVMLWSRGNYFLLFGNYRDALPVYIRAFGYGRPEARKADLDLAGSLIFCAFKLAGKLTLADEEGGPSRGERFARAYAELCRARRENRLAEKVSELARPEE